jgi:ethanolamine utilization cobalamin adenosyltransferase
MLGFLLVLGTALPQLSLEEIEGLICIRLFLKSRFSVLACDILSTLNAASEMIAVVRLLAPKAS